MHTLSDLGVTKRQTTLSSGVRLVLLERPNMPVSVTFLFKAGSRFDPVDKEGLVHFLEHIIVAGSKKFPSKDKLATYIEQVGGTFGAGTSPETLEINFDIADAADFNRVVILANEMVCNALFSPKIIENERGSILRELASKRSSPDKTLSDIERQLFFQKTELGRTNIGTVESLDGIHDADLKKCYMENLSAENMVIVASGGISLEVLAETLESGMGFKHFEAKATSSEVPVVREESVKVQKYLGNEEVHFSLGFRTTPLPHPDIIPLGLLRMILASGRASRLTKKLRYEKGLVYGIWAGQFAFSDTGAFYVSSATSKDKLQEVLDVIVEEIRLVCNGDISEEELSNSKSRVLKSARLGLQSSRSWVSYYAYPELLGLGDLLGVEQYQAKVEQTGLEELTGVAQKYFVPGSWYLAMAGGVEEGFIGVNY